MHLSYFASVNIKYISHKFLSSFSGGNYFHFYSVDVFQHFLLDTSANSILKIAPSNTYW